MKFNTRNSKISRKREKKKQKKTATEQFGADGGKDTELLTGTPANNQPTKSIAISKFKYCPLDDVASFILCCCCYCCCCFSVFSSKHTLKASLLNRKDVENETAKKNTILNWGSVVVVAVLFHFISLVFLYCYFDAPLSHTMNNNNSNDC